MAVTIKQVVLQSSTTSSVNSTFVTTAAINPGEDIFIAMGRNTVGGVATGIVNITTSAGAGTFERVATAVRASTFDVHIGRFRVTTLIPSGSTITAVATSAASKRGGVMQVVSGLKTTYTAAHRSSGTASQGGDGATSAGPNGSSTTSSASTTAATTVADCFVISAHSWGGTTTITPGAGMTELGKSKTTSGTADRGVQLEYKIVAATGVQTATATISASGGWAATVAAFEIEPDPPPSGRVDEFTAASGSATSLVISVPRAVSVGKLNVVSFAALSSTGTFTITDSRGNTYTVDDGPADHGLGAQAGYARQGQAVISTALQVGDSITITCSGATPSRWAAVAGIFNLPVNPSFAMHEASEQGTGTSVSTPTIITVRNAALVVISHYMVSTGRVATTANGWSHSPKVISTGGSGERAVIQAWKYVPTPNTIVESYMTYDSSGANGTIFRVFEVPAAALLLKRWTGSVWETCTLKRWTGAAWETLTLKEL